MDNGWIKLYRVLLDKYIWLRSTPEQKVILITLLLMANHEPHKWMWNKKDYEVQKGQFITSTSSIVQKCGRGVSTQNVRSALKKFEELDFLTIESTNTNSLITITNWEEYQPKDDKVTNEPTRNQQATNKEVTKTQQTTNKEVTTNKNERMKEVKKDTNVSTSIAKQSTDEINYENVINYFNNKTKGVFGMVRYPINENRRKSVRARIREHGKEALADMINNAIQSDFLKGENKHSFKATFDWLMKPSNFQKTLEGNYNNKEQTNGKDKRDTTSSKLRTEFEQLAKDAGMAFDQG